MRPSIRTASAYIHLVGVRSADLHRAIGCTVTGPVPSYNEPVRDMLVFERNL